MTDIDHVSLARMQIIQIVPQMNRVVLWMSTTEGLKDSTYLFVGLMMVQIGRYAGIAAAIFTNPNVKHDVTNIFGGQL